MHFAERIPTQGGSIRVIIRRNRVANNGKIYTNESQKMLEKYQHIKTGKLIERIIFKINKNFQN